MADPLAVFALNRQAAIIRRYLCRVSISAGEPEGLGAYRSAENIRVIIDADLTTSCKQWMGYEWGQPGPFKNASRRRLYDLLVEEFGPMCVVCRRLFGWVIDHDHISGMVRGLVCRGCNQAVDSCLHANSAECYIAEYLNEPPAERLQLRYPGRQKQKSMDVVRDAILGFDIFDKGQWPSPIPAEWHWVIPPESTLVEIRNDWWRRHPNAEGCPRHLFEDDEK